MESESQAHISVIQGFSPEPITSIMAIMYQFMDEALDKVFEQLQLQLKQPFIKSKPVQ